MAKIKTNQKFELMFLGAVVVIMAGFLIIFSQHNSGVKPASAYEETTLGAEVGDSSKELMDSLKATNDDGGVSEFNKLRNEASGL